MSADREIRATRADARAMHRLDDALGAFLIPPVALSQAASTAGVSVAAMLEADVAISWASRTRGVEPAVSAWSSSLSGAAMSTIQGGQDAHRLVASIREGLAPADALLEGLHAIAATKDDDRLHGACRGLQKALEGRA